jgi:hypothetical protein
MLPRLCLGDRAASHGAELTSKALSDLARLHAEVSCEAQRERKAGPGKGWRSV